MGKTPKSRDSNSRRNSLSLSGSSKTCLINSVSTHKNMLSAKKLHNKKRKSIQKIFEKLVRQSISETKVDTNDNSVVLIDDTDEKASTSMKRKRSSIKKPNKKNQETVNESCVIINDDDDDDLITSDSPCANTSKSSVRFPESLKSPFSSSTPNRNAKRTKINVSALSNIQNNSPESFTDTDNRTKEVNLNSFLTIDLTAESNNTRNSSVTDNTVIDLDKHDTSDCMFVSANNSSLSMSGDSDVTVVKAKKRNKKDNMKVFEMRIAKMSANEKGRLLEIITKNIFSGCKSPAVASSTTNNKGGVPRAMETAEDTYIKEIILGPSKSRNSVGSNIYNPSRDLKNRQGLRMIIIDGSNVAMEHGNRRVFSVKGLKICIDYFLKRGHIVKAFVPRFRCKYGKSTDPRLLDELERQRLVVYTPSRELPGKFICSYDDRYIVQCAAEFDGVIVTGDNYRDLMNENAKWRFVIENRLLPFTWVNDMIMFPKDPLGRTGPTLEMFLKHSA